MAIDQATNKKLGKLRTWNIVVGLILAVQAVMMAILTNNFALPVTATFMEGRPGSPATLQTIWKINPKIEIIMQEYLDAKFDVRIHVLGDKIGDARNGSEDKAQQADPGGTNVEIEDSLDLSHYQFGGSKEKRQIGGNCQNDNGYNIKYL